MPVYGPLNTVVPAEVAEEWLVRLMELCPDDPMGRLAAMQMSRRTDDRYRDVSEKVRADILAWLERSDAPQVHATLAGLADQRIDTVGGRDGVAGEVLRRKKADHGGQHGYGDQGQKLPGHRAASTCSRWAANSSGPK